MKNPWRSRSNVNPQRENGHREIANDVFRELIKADLTGAELKVCMSVISHTWGFSKLSDAIPTQQIARETGLALRTVKQTVKLLKARRFICSQPSTRVIHGSPVNEYLFNKHWDTWLPRAPRRVSQSARVSQNAGKQVSQSSPSKENSKRKSPAARERTPDPRVKSLIDYYAQRFQAVTNSRLLIEGSRDGQRIKKALSTFSEEEIRRRIDLFLNDNDRFIASMARNIPNFVRMIDRYAGSNGHRETKGLPLAEFTAESE